MLPSLKRDLRLVEPMTGAPYLRDLEDERRAPTAPRRSRRALERAKKMLDEYEEPALDPAKDEELRDHIARREREIPAVDALNEEH